MQVPEKSFLEKVKSSGENIFKWFFKTSWNFSHENNFRRLRRFPPPLSQSPVDGLATENRICDVSAWYCDCDGNTNYFLLLFFINTRENIFKVAQNLWLWLCWHFLIFAKSDRWYLSTHWRYKLSLFDKWWYKEITMESQLTAGAESCISDIFCAREWKSSGRSEGWWYFSDGFNFQTWCESGSFVFPGITVFRPSQSTVSTPGGLRWSMSINPSIF